MNICDINSNVKTKSKIELVPGDLVSLGVEAEEADFREYRNIGIVAYCRSSKFNKFNFRYNVFWSDSARLRLQTCWFRDELIKIQSIKKEK